jgi:short-chain fatty acids transporter
VNGRLQRIALGFTAFAERWLPDAFVFALAATAIVFFAGLAVGARPLELVDAWGSGFWELLSFTMQMALVIITGYVVAAAAPVRRLIVHLASRARSPRGAVAMVAAFAMLSAWLNWGFSLVFSAVLAREIARRTRGVDYRALVAASLLGLGSVWAQGLSGSAALQMATPGALPPRVREIVSAGVVPGGLLSFAHTIFLWQSLVSVAVELAVVTAVMWLAAPTGEAARDAQALGIALPGDDGASGMNVHSAPGEGPSERRTPGEWLEHSSLLTLLICALGGVYLARSFFGGKGVASLTLNSINLLLLLVGFALHRTPARLMRAVREATPATWGVVLQFPFYAGIAGMIAATRLNERIAGVFVSLSSQRTFPALMSLYSAVLGVFVPSGGSKWLIEAPYVMKAAHELRVHLGWVVACYDLGEAVANLVQPFWMLPVLALCGLRARDVMGYTFLVFLVLLPLVLVLTTLLGATLGYPL